MTTAESPRGFFSLRNAKIWQKLLLASSVFLIPVAVLGYFLVAQTLHQLSITKNDNSIVSYLNAAHTASQALQDHRRLATTGLDSKSKLSDVETYVKRLQDADVLLNSTQPPSSTVRDISDLLSKLKAANNSKGSELQNQLLVKLSELTRKTTEVSQFHQQSPYEVIQLQRWLVLLLSEADYHNQLQSLVSEVAKNKQPTPDQSRDLLKLQLALSANREEFQSIENNLHQANEETLNALKAPLQAYQKARDSSLELLQTLFFTNDPDQKKAQEVTGKAVNETNQFFTTLTGQLEQTLRNRRQSLLETLAYTIAAIVAGLLLTTMLSWLIFRPVSRQLTAVDHLFHELGQGNYKVRAAVHTRDELGRMAEGLNKNVLPLIQSHDERAQLQGSIMKLLNDVSGVAEGDLSKEAEVTADATGAIADSFNNMIAQLRGIIGKVQDATLHLSTSANEIQSTAKNLSQGSDQQTEQIIHTSGAIDEMTVSIQQVADHANVSSQVANHALEYARKGNAAVHDTMEGMTRIRDQVQETAKRLKRLGESSQEIGSIIQLIEDISDRTSILALNASIQAAAAGDAGRGFAVVAEEIESLAERSAEATKKISGLIKTIQSETGEAVASMDKSITEVVEGSKVATQAGQSLHEITTVSTRLSELIQQITLAAKQQARGSDVLAKSMSDMSQITQQTAQGTKKATESVNHLARMADELRNSLNMFRLPRKPGTRELSPQQLLQGSGHRLRVATTKPAGSGSHGTKETRSILN